jgi:mevalonate kinase
MKNDRKIVVFGKVLLSGEHSVVYGYPALVAGISMPLEVMIEAADHFTLESDSSDEMGLVRESLSLVGVAQDLVKVRIKSEIPPGSGLGSSAALCAGVIRAGSDYLGKKLSKKQWFELAWQAEKKAHGNSSGVDPAAAVYGGVLWYLKNKEMTQVRLQKRCKLLLMQSGKPDETTGEMVARVAKGNQLDPHRQKKIFRALGKVTTAMRSALEEGKDLWPLVDENGKLLEELGVVGEKTRKFCGRLRELSCGVKISGAGGVRNGSGMLVVAHQELDTIQTELATWGCDLYPVSIGGS